MRVLMYQFSRVLFGNVTFVSVAYFGHTCIHIFVSAWNTHYKAELHQQSHTTCVYVYQLTTAFTPKYKKASFWKLYRNKVNRILVYVQVFVYEGSFTS